MEQEIMDTEISPKQAASALGVSERTLYFWLDKEQVPGAYQTITGRWRMTVGSLVKLVQSKATRDGGRTEARFQKWLEEGGWKSVA